MRWDDRRLFIGERHVATAATHEGERGVYSVWVELPDADEPHDIKGLSAARKAAEQSVRDWFSEVLST
jgi:hypothetical protein